MGIYVTSLISEDDTYRRSLREFINEYDRHTLSLRTDMGDLQSLITGHALFSLLLLPRTIRADLRQASLE